MTGRRQKAIFFTNIRYFIDMENYEDKRAEDRPVIPDALRNSRCKRRNTILAVLVALLVAMSLTCPDEAKHNAAVNREVKIMITDMPSENDAWGAIGNIMASGIASLAVDQMLDVEDYVFFSTGTMRYGDRSRMVSFGIFNHVFTFDSEYIRQSEEKEED